MQSHFLSPFLKRKFRDDHSRDHQENTDNAVAVGFFPKDEGRHKGTAHKGKAANKRVKNNGIHRFCRHGLEEGNGKKSSCHNHHIKSFAGGGGCILVRGRRFLAEQRQQQQRKKEGK